MASIFYNNVEYGGAGNDIHYGTSTPASSLGNSGDAYFRLDANGNLMEQYIKLGSDWTLIPKADAVLGSKTITANGNYIAQSDSLDGYSNVSVNVPTGGSTLITKTITQNGTYDAEDDNADGYSQVTVNVSGGGGASIERLFSASENSSSVRHTDHAHKAYFDDGVGTITEDSNYSNYLSYDNSTNEFEVLQGFTALIIPWTYEYSSASGSYPHGEFYINGTSVSNWRVDYKPQGYFLGTPLIHTFNQGDTFYSYTPSGDGYPEQNLKVYKIDSASASLFTDMFTFHNVSGGVGSIIT